MVKQDLVFAEFNQKVVIFCMVDEVVKQITGIGVLLNGQLDLFGGERVDDLLNQFLEFGGLV